MRPNTSMDSPACARGNLVVTVGRLQSSIRSRSTLMGSAEQPPIIERSQMERCIRRVWSFFGQLPICHHLIAFASLLGLLCTPLCCASQPVIIDILPHHKSPRYTSALVGQRNSHNIDVSATHQTVDPVVACARRSLLRHPTIARAPWIINRRI